jgi:hypothetical protein
MRRQPVNGGAGVPVSRFLPARLLQIRCCPGGVGNGINHGETRGEFLRCGKFDLLDFDNTIFTSDKKLPVDVDTFTTSSSCQQKDCLGNLKRNAGRGRFWKPPV